MRRTNISVKFGINVLQQNLLKGKKKSNVGFKKGTYVNRAIISIFTMIILLCVKSNVNSNIYFIFHDTVIINIKCIYVQILYYK